MPTTAPDPYTIAANAVAAAIDAEFSDLAITTIHDNLHDSLGAKRRAAGVAPERKTLLGGNAVVSEVWIQVKFFDFWRKEINPETTVDPRVITTYANRFERAMRVASAHFPGSPEVWYFDVVQIDFPNDPTGNKTRFQATVKAHGDNTGLVETG